MSIHLVCLQLYEIDTIIIFQTLGILNNVPNFTQLVIVEARWKHKWLDFRAYAVDH